MQRLSSLFVNLLNFCGLIVLIARPAHSESDSSTPRTKGLNPDTSINFLGKLQHGYEGDPIQLNEAELQFTADVDPYLRAVSLFALESEDGEFEFGPEELYFETLSLPSLTLKAGKFKASLGRHNSFHRHAFPFLNAPLINESLLGEEGLNDTGLSASVLLPTPWFMEFTAQGLSGNSDVLFNSRKQGNFAGVFQLKNLFELSDASTLEFQVYTTGGRNQFNKNSLVYGTDLTFKWRPTDGGKYQSLSATLAFLSGNVDGNDDLKNLNGFATWVQYQFAQRWWAQARFDALLSSTFRESALLGFFPSEFSGFRLQYDHSHATGTASQHAVALQWNISIGAHPAHTY